MTKEEINKRIFELKTEDEIRQFIKQRIDELETMSEEKVVGQNYTDSFGDYISSKTHYKPAEKFQDAECPDLIYDDVEPYVNLIKAIKENTWYNELLLFTTIFFEVYKYLPSDDMGLGRYFTYASHKGDKVSIKEIRDNGVAFCSEKSGLAHNMFKLLGVDSEVVVGARDSEMHAYNLVYPKGYGNFPVAIYDPSHFVSFLSGDSKISFGYYKTLSEEGYESLKSGEPYRIDLTKTEQAYRKLYGWNGMLDEYSFSGDTPCYTYGLDAAKKNDKFK
jgi:hypothetical protein